MCFMATAGLIQHSNLTFQRPVKCSSSGASAGMLMQHIVTIRPCENVVQDERWNIATAIKISNFPADGDCQGTELLVTE